VERGQRISRVECRTQVTELVAGEKLQNDVQWAKKEVITRALRVGHPVWMLN